MDLALAILCDGAIERPDGRFDIVGLFDELEAPGFPAVQSSMTVVLVMEWAADESGAQAFRADLVGQSGSRVLTIEGETEVPTHAAGRPRPRTRIILPVENVVFPRAGQYRFHLVAGGDVHPACSVFVRERSSE